MNAHVDSLIPSASAVALVGLPSATYFKTSVSLLDKDLDRPGRTVICNKNYRSVLELWGVIDTSCPRELRRLPRADPERHCPLIYSRRLLASSARAGVR